MSLTTVLLSGGAGGVITWFGGLAAKQKVWPAIAAALKKRAQRIAAKAEAELQAKAFAYESQFRSALVAELVPVMGRLKAIEEKVGIAPGPVAPASEQQQQLQGGGA